MRLYHPASKTISTQDARSTDLIDLSLSCYLLRAIKQATHPLARDSEIIHKLEVSILPDIQYLTHYELILSIVSRQQT